MSTPQKQMIGLTFGNIKVIEESESSTPKDKKFIVSCNLCGSIKTMYGGNIRRSKFTSTGGCKCTQSDKVVGQFKQTHKLSGHRLCGTWRGIITRCYSDKHMHYKNYGGRGISVCKEWRDSPSAFILWAEINGLEKGMQIDRKDNNGNYTPSNCRVVTAKINCNNTRRSRFLTVFGEKLTISEAASKYGINKTTIKERMNRGWDGDRCVSIKHGTTGGSIKHDKF